MTHATVKMEEHFGYPSKKVSGEFTLYNKVKIRIKKGKGSRKWNGVEATIIFITNDEKIVVGAHKLETIINNDGKREVVEGDLAMALVSQNQIVKI